MRQLINALLKYKNTLLYLGLLISSLIFLNHRSFYHQSIFSNAFLVLSSNFNLLGKNVSSYMSLSENNEKLISKIDSALRRIEDGSYGFCEETGDPISFKRLDARPIATLSLEAQERHERRERVHRDD